VSEPADVRVLYVIDSLAQGGAERSLAEVAPHVVAQGVDLHVAVLHDRPGYTGLFEEAGIPVWRVVRRTRPGWIVGLARLTRSLRPDLVHTTLFESDVCGRPAAWVCGTPVTTSLVNSPPTTPPPGLKARLAELDPGVRIAALRSLYLLAEWDSAVEGLAAIAARRSREPARRGGRIQGGAGGPYSSR